MSSKVKLLITKISAEGEQCAFEVSDVMLDDIEDMTSRLQGLVDKRMFEMNNRMLEATKLLNTCTPAERMKLRAILDVVYGRSDPERVRKGLVSYIEELEDVERLSSLNNGRASVSES